jgi:hypothetical protein
LKYSAQDRVSSKQADSGRELLSDTKSGGALPKDGPRRPAQCRQKNEAPRPLLISGLVTPTMRSWNEFSGFIEEWDQLRNRRGVGTARSMGLD